MEALRTAFNMNGKKRGGAAAKPYPPGLV